MVDVAPDVALEVLDYGGTGVPVILLAGLGNTGHVFDDFAPRLTDRHHVYAITRRGFGASSQPNGGYDVATRVADDLAVLAALGYERAIWIGHSLAGDELTAIAVRHPARALKLVYLDATHDHGAGAKQLFESMPPEPEPEEPPADTWNDPVKLHAWMNREAGVELPFGETLALTELVPNAPPRDRSLADAWEKLIEGTGPQNFAAVRIPALVVVAPADGPQSVMPRFSSMTREDQQAWRDAWPTLDRFMQDGYRNVRANLAGAKMVVLRNSHHYVFIRSADEVLAEIRTFIHGATHADDE